MIASDAKSVIASSVCQVYHESQAVSGRKQAKQEDRDRKQAKQKDSDRKASNARQLSQARHSLRARRNKNETAFARCSAGRGTGTAASETKNINFDADILAINRCMRTRISTARLEDSD